MAKKKVEKAVEKAVEEEKKDSMEGLSVDPDTGEVTSNEIEDKKSELRKKFFNLQNYREKTNLAEVEYKKQEWINMSPGFKDTTKLPGIPIGHTTMNYGKSDVGKTTMLVEAGAYAIKQGILPILVITENKFSWDRAEKMGLYKDFCIVHNGVETIEEGWERIMEHLEDLEKGKMQKESGISNVIFLWDSIGATPSRRELDASKANFENLRKIREAMVTGGKAPAEKSSSGGMMVTAKVLREKFTRDLCHKINKTRESDCPYDATLLIVNHAYTAPPAMPNAPSTLKPYGGDAIWLAATLVFRMGGVMSNSSKVIATKNGTDVSFAIKSALNVEKNHITEIAAKGKIICTDHGFVKDDKAAIDKYKKEHKDGWDLQYDSYWDAVSDE